MKNINTLLSAVADQYGVSVDDVRRDLRAYFDHLMEDPAFRRAWEEIPKIEGLAEEEFLLALMAADAISK